MNYHHTLSILTIAPLSVLACGSDPDPQSTEHPLIHDARVTVPREDGRFDVLCQNGSHEVVTYEDIRANHVCLGGSPDGGGGVGTPVTLSASSNCSEVLALVKPSTDCSG